MKYIVTEETMNIILGYLGKRPYVEVEAVVEAIRQTSTVASESAPEPELDLEVEESFEDLGEVAES